MKTKENDGEISNAKVLKLSNTVLIISMVIACLSIFLLWRENIKLREEKNELKTQILAASGTLIGLPSAQVGDVVPAFETAGLDGKQVRIVYDGGSKYLLYIFSPQCDACSSQFPVWEKITAQIKAKPYKTIGLSTESAEDTKTHLGMESLNFDILIMPQGSIQRAYRVVAEPVMMIVSSEGKIEWVHYGVLTQNKVSELSPILGVDLRDVL